MTLSLGPQQAAQGVLLVLAAAALWGTTGTSQQLSGTQLDPAWYGGGRLLVAAAFFALLALAQRATRAQAVGGGAPIGTPQHLMVLGAGVAMASYNLAFFAGIRLTGVALGTAVALGSGPLWAGLLEAVVHRKLPTRAWWLGTALAVTGGALMTGLVDAGTAGATGLSPTGLVLCLCAGLSYAVYALLTQRLAAVLPATTVTLRAFSVAAALALPAAAWHAGLPAPLRGADGLALLYVGVVATGVAYLLFSLALRHVSAATAVTLALFEPVTACLLAVSVLGETLAAAAWLGLALVLAGVVVVTRAELRAGGATA